ncbi:putative sensory transducer protein YvaQ [Tenuibacillus multivorans]|uniref:methyl-accepting chemotaxis protein n=1 Tax=Tenuibacillus multivorans TaxID=237069 RepID=UPI000B837D59|nr:methyl-accepting chemotaxis protein [Tenuibacillus multivorans]GEL77628.1 putative sensory transducer protein YvaQ [Tenuibacillus multivorans]
MRRVKWRNVRIGWKYGFIFILTLCFFVASAGIVTYLMQGVDQNIDAMDQRADRSVNITDMTSQFRAKDAIIADYVLSRDLNLIEEYEQKRNGYNDLQVQVELKMDTPEQEELFKQIQSNDRTMNDLFLNQIVPAIEERDTAIAMRYREEASKLSSDTAVLLDQLRSLIDEERQLAIQHAKESSTYASFVLIISVASSIILGGLLLIFVSRGIRKHLKKVVLVSNEVAAGHLNVKKLDNLGKDEIGEIANSMNAMIDNLRDMVSKVQGISETVSSQSEELTQSANEVSNGAEQVAATMEELSSSAEQQSHSSNQISNLSNQLNQQIDEANEGGKALRSVSSEVKEQSTNGNKQIEMSVQQMNEITTIVAEAVEKVEHLEEYSTEISKLIDVIQDIAEQTNLLALNAAIEAARAGESGKGFAVVADEVRKLAEQVAESVKEITGIIQGIQTETKSVVQSLELGHNKVMSGNQQIKVSQDSFHSINSAVDEMITQIKNASHNLREVASHSQNVLAASEEIAANSEEAAAGIEQSSATAQQQSSSMQEITSSAESLSQLAEDMNDLIRRFKL